MSTDTGRPVSAIAVKVPRQLVSVNYRAYAQALTDDTLLEWLLARFRASAPPDNDILFACDSTAEATRLKAALHHSHSAHVLSTDARDDIHQCQLLMDALKVRRLAMSGFGHVIAPVRLIRDLMSIHTELEADLTTASCPWFSEPLYVINRTLVARLTEIRTPQPARHVLKAAAVLHDIHSHTPREVPGFRWIHFDVAKHYRIAPGRWPEPVSVTSARDVEILREMSAGIPEHDCNALVNSYKEAAIRVRERRLRKVGTPTSPAKGRHPYRIRVLYGSSTSEFTGAQQSLCHLVGALDPEDVERMALVSYEGAFTDALRRAGATVISPNHNIANIDPESFIYARHIIAEYRPDIIHVNHTVGLPVLNAAVAAGVPLIQHVRVQAPWRLGDHIYIADAVIAVSEFVRQQIARLDIDLTKVHVIMNGVNTDQFKPHPEAKADCRRRFRIEAGEFVVLMIARLARNKRHDTVITAIGQLRRTIGRGHLLLVGAADGERQYLQEIRTHIAQQGLADHTTTIDFMPDIRAAHYASDVLALPSEEEPLSRAVLEAMAIGLPVVVGDSGGTKEVIQPGVNGFVVPCGAPDRLCLTLCELVQDSHRAHKVGMAANETIRASLTAVHCAAKTMSLYRRLFSHTDSRADS